MEGKQTRSVLVLTELEKLVGQTLVGELVAGEIEDFQRVKRADRARQRHELVMAEFENA